MLGNLEPVDPPVLDPWRSRLGAAQAIIGAGALAAGLVGGSATLVLGFPVGWAILSATGALLVASSGISGLVHAYRVISSVQLRGAAAPDALAKSGVRLTLMAHKRVGDELVGEAVGYRRYGDGLVSDADAQDWAGSVLHFLFENGSPQDQERFLTAGAGHACERMRVRLAVLRELIEEWPRDR